MIVICSSFPSYRHTCVDVNNSLHNSLCLLKLIDNFISLLFRKFERMCKTLIQMLLCNALEWNVIASLKTFVDTPLCIVVPMPSYPILSNAILHCIQ